MNRLYCAIAAAEPPRLGTTADAGEAGAAPWNAALEAAAFTGTGEPAARSGQVLAACIGRPRWLDTDLQRIAAAEGTAAACVAAYGRHGADFVDAMAGEFSCVLWDARDALAFAAVDRFAIYPLYFATPPGGGLLVATDAASLVGHAGVGDALSMQGVYDYVFFHVVPSPGTIYRHVRKLDPAHRLRYRKGEVDIGCYWKPAFEEHGEEQEVELAEELRRSLQEAVSRRLGGDEAAGAFLSGGLDSSTVVGMMARDGRRPARAYSIGFDAQGYDETPYARVAAEAFGAEHKIYYVSPDDVVESLPRIAQAYSEPFGNASVVPAYHCARFAREDGVRLMLAGDGGDELFAGNAHYAKQLTFERYYRLPAWARSALFEPLLQGPLAGGWRLGQKARSYVNQARIPLPERLETYNYLNRPETAGLFARDFLGRIDADAPNRAMRDWYGAVEPASVLNRMLYLDWKFTLADDDLQKVTRMCHLAGVEVTFPMLDEAVVQMSCRVPSRMKMRGTHLRTFYKQAMEGFLPESIINKRKHGFGLPFGVWMRSHAGLQSLAYDSIHSLGGRGFFDPAFLDRAVDLHRTEHAAYYGGLIWILTVLELWLQRHPHSV